MNLEMNCIYAIDTNILVYAFDSHDMQKHTIAKNILIQTFMGKRELVVTTQCLAEFSVVVRKKIGLPLKKEDVQKILSSIKSNIYWHIIPYSSEHILKANNYDCHFWDSLLAETIKKYNYVLLTENESDFKHKGILTKNPFK